MNRTWMLAAIAATTVSGAASATTQFFIGASDWRGFSNDGGDTGFDAPYATARSDFLDATGFVSATDSLEEFDASNDVERSDFDLDWSSVGVMGSVEVEGDFTPRLITDTDPQSGNRRDGTDLFNMFYTGLEAGNDEVQSGTIGIDFDPNNKVRGFGFSITDLGDFGATLVIQTTGGTEILDLEQLAEDGEYGLDENGFDNGDHIWISFITESTLTGVDILMENASAGGDRFSFDEFSVLVVPVPPAVGLAALGLAGVAWQRRRMNRG